MNNRMFPDHGYFALQIDGNLLVIDAEGPANIELIQKYRRDVQVYRQQLSGQRWGNLVIFHGDSLITHESIEAMKDSILDAKKCGMAAVAIVLDNVSYSSMATQLWGGFYRNADMPHQFFTDIQQARLWLQAQLD
ncbi:hypothetical protein [Neptunicella sp. SCSIO 80796]|uniref:hypothetical protein n=1 Tax=Neptunicella plasticusilytica TaxID=3117012 RepID=UPI003A4E4E39